MDNRRRGAAVSMRADRHQLLTEVVDEAPRHAASAVRFNIAVAQALGMPLADLQCLGLLAQHPAAPVALAEQLGLTTGAATKLLDRLERAGFVRRLPDPADRRRVIVAAKSEPLAAVAPHYAAMGDRMAKYLAARTDAELAVILDFMRAGRDAADQEISRIRDAGIHHARRTPRAP